MATGQNGDTFSGVLNRWRQILTLALFAAAACGGDASTKTGPREITLNGYACKACRVVAESIAYLGHPDDTVALREDVIPARDARGRYYLADLKGGMVLVFGPDGRLMRTFGKPGRGPGEFVSLRAIYARPGDTLFVLGGPTVHVMAPDYAQVREYRTLGGSVDEIASTLLADGRILSGGSRHRFTLIDSVGQISARITLQGIDSTPCGECGERVFRESRTPGLIWSGPLNAYRVEQHDITGALKQRFVVHTNWFKAWGPSEIEARTVVVELSRSRLVGAREGSDGIVWTHVSGADASGLGNIDEDVPKQMAELWSRLETHIDAIDPARGELVAGTVLKGLVIPMSGEYSAQLCVDEAGGWAWKILKFRVEGRVR